MPINTRNRNLNCTTTAMIAMIYDNETLKCYPGTDRDRIETNEKQNIPMKWKRQEKQCARFGNVNRFRELHWHKGNKDGIFSCRCQSFGSWVFFYVQPKWSGELNYDFCYEKPQHHSKYTCCLANPQRMMWILAGALVFHAFCAHYTSMWYKSTIGIFNGIPFCIANLLR